MPYDSDKANLWNTETTGGYHQHTCTRKIYAASEGQTEPNRPDGRSGSIHAASYGHEYGFHPPRHTHAVSFWSFLLLMTGQSWKNAASSGQNSSLMPTTLFNLVWFLLASASSFANLMHHHELQIRFSVSIIFILGCFDTALWSSASSWGWHLSHFSQLWCSITRSNENRRRFSVCLHGAGPICKQIKYVYWGGQANEKRRLVWTSLENDAGYKITPAELLPICRNL